MDPITAFLQAVNGVAALATSLAELETVTRKDESAAHRTAREEFEIEGYKIGKAGLQAVLRLLTISIPKPTEAPKP